MISQQYKTRGECKRFLCTSFNRRPFCFQPSDSVVNLFQLKRHHDSEARNDDNARGSEAGNDDSNIAALKVRGLALRYKTNGFRVILGLHTLPCQHSNLILQSTEQVLFQEEYHYRFQSTIVTKQFTAHIQRSIAK